MSEEWGDWIEHDGKGYPEGVIGRVCQATQVSRSRGVFTGAEFVCLGHWPDGGSWNWDNYPETTKVILYRIRKPKGVTILEKLLADLPVPLCAQPHALIEANSPASTTHGPTLGLFIPSQCVLPARDGGGVSSSQGPAATYSSEAA